MTRRTVPLLSWITAAALTFMLGLGLTHPVSAAKGVLKISLSGAIELPAGGSNEPKVCGPFYIQAYNLMAGHTYSLLLPTTDLSGKTGTAVSVVANQSGVVNYGPLTVANGHYKTALDDPSTTHGKGKVDAKVFKVDCAETPPPVTCASTPLGAATGFNVFVFGDMSGSGSDVEGRLAVGGNATLTDYAVGLKAPLTSPPANVLLVGGNLTFTRGSINNGNALVGGSATLSQVAVPNGTVMQGTAPALDFSAAQSSLRSESTYLATLAANGATTLSGSTLTLSGSNPGLNIFSVSGPDLANARALVINVPVGATVLVNISGTAAQVQNVDFAGVPSSLTSSILYNFSQATSLTIALANIKGSVLAPFASVMFVSGVVNGTLIAQTLSGGGQSNSGQFNTSGQSNTASFTGCLPVPGSTSASSESDSSSHKDDQSGRDDQHNSAAPHHGGHGHGGKQ